MATHEPYCRQKTHLSLIVCLSFRDDMFLRLLLRSTVLLLLVYAASTQDWRPLGTFPEYAEHDAGPTFTNDLDETRQVRNVDGSFEPFIAKADQEYSERKKRDVDSVDPTQNVTETIDHNADSDIALAADTANQINSEAVNQDEGDNSPDRTEIDNVKGKDEESVTNSEMKVTQEPVVASETSASKENDNKEEDEDLLSNRVLQKKTNYEQQSSVDFVKEGKHIKTRDREYISEQKAKNNIHDQQNGGEKEDTRIDISGSGENETGEKEIDLKEEEKEEKESERNLEEQSRANDTGGPTPSVDEDTINKKDSEDTNEKEDLEKRHNLRKLHDLFCEIFSCFVYQTIFYETNLD